MLSLLKWGSLKQPASESTPSALDECAHNDTDYPHAAAETVATEDCEQCLQVASDIPKLLPDYQDLIVERINSAQAISNQELLAIGDCVNSIVCNVRDYIEETKTSVDSSFKEQRETMEDYLSKTQSVSTTQDSAVTEALELSGKIAEAGGSIKRLAGAARILALNAGIEASRMGVVSQPLVIN